MHFIRSELAKHIMLRELTSSFMTFFKATITKPLKMNPITAKNMEKNSKKENACNAVSEQSLDLNHFD